MSNNSITPESFFSDQPPTRLIGTECEYTIQKVKQNSSSIIPLGNYISEDALQSCGVFSDSSFLSNGGRLYVDGDLIEYATPESSGPLQAAATDSAGLLLMQRIIMASKLPHNGVYRLSGSSIDGTSFSAGYHENFLIPGSLTTDGLLEGVVPSLLATKLWATSGIVRNNYEFSQKAPGIGATWLGSVVKHGAKPMAMLRPFNYMYRSMNGELLQQEAWARLEVRMADPTQSPTIRYLALAATSLALRLIEHADHPAASRLPDTMLDNPVAAAKLFSQDLSLKKTALTRNGKLVTACDVQEILAESSLQLIESGDVELPDDEVFAAYLWQETIDAFRKTRPDLGDYGDLTNKLDVAAKHKRILSVTDTINDSNYEAVKTSLLWDRIVRPGTSERWRNGQSLPFSGKLLEEYVIRPPKTRASERVALMIRNRQYTNYMGWDAASTGNGEFVEFEPYPQ